MINRRLLSAIFISVTLLMTGCVRPQTSMSEIWVPANPTGAPVKTATALPQPQPVTVAAAPTSTPTVHIPPTQTPTDIPRPSPTPDAARPVPTLRTETDYYTVKAGDSLAVIARQHGVDINTVAEANQISNPNLLGIGQYLVIPPPNPKFNAPDFKIIPDAELVYGPKSMGFDIASFIHQYNGYLDSYREKVDDELIDGATIIQRVSQEHSINPRILLAVLEYQSGWVTEKDPQKQPTDYPMGFRDGSRKGLFKQLFWAANNLNRGFYDWITSSYGAWILTDSTVVPVSAVVNAGTAAVQYLMSLLKDQYTWYDAVSQEGVYATYSAFFGYPFDFTLEPLVPDDLSLPQMQLPMEEGVLWYFTGGPHMGWDDGSPSAALDFAPADVRGCYASGTWETAVADGVIARSGYGSVVLDLDGDGYEQTGWTVLYLHVAGWERIEAGTRVKAGDRIGHASCEGGYALAAHLHIARRYNGIWILADGTWPFVMDGWVPEGTGWEYNGYLKKDGVVIEAWDGRSEINKIWR